MPRRTSGDTAVAQRIKDRRQTLGWSVRYAADRAGISHTTWSRIERGQLSADNRFTLASIADALRCPVTTLTGLPVDAVDRDQAETGGAVYDTMRAIIEADLDFVPRGGEVPPIEPLLQELTLARDLRERCEYPASAQRLAGLFRGFHAAAFGQERSEALRGLVIAGETASIVVRYAGHPASACLAGERAQQAAEALEDPVMLGMAAWARALAASGCGLYERMTTVAERGARELEPHIGRPEAPEMLGMLYLCQAFGAYALGQVGTAVDALTAAEDIANRTGDTTTLQLMFGPTNVKFWRIAMASDGDDPGHAVELARGTNPQAIPVPIRQSSFYLDVSRALARTGKDKDALRMLLTAERIAPQRMTDPLVTETVRGLLDRARRGTGWTELRGLAERVGVGV